MIELICVFWVVLRTFASSVLQSLVLARLARLYYRLRARSHFAFHVRAAAQRLGTRATAQPGQHTFPVLVYHDFYTRERSLRTQPPSPGRHHAGSFPRPEDPHGRHHSIHA